MYVKILDALLAGASFRHDLHRPSSSVACPNRLPIGVELAEKPVRTEKFYRIDAH